MVAETSKLNPTIIVIPTYNEIENLQMIVNRTLAATPDLDVLVVDDNSPDGTGKLADEMAAANPRMHVLHRPGKQGLGVAYLSGFGWALEQGYENFFEMDADGSHPPEKLPEMIDLLKTHDMVVGSRWMPGGKVVNWPKRREFLSRGGNLYTRIMLRIPVKDATGGFRGFTRTAFDKIDLNKVESQGYCFQTDLLWRALQAKLGVIETPITFTERVNGYSKMSGGIVVEALLKVTEWGVQRFFKDFFHRK